MCMGLVTKPTAILSDPFSMRRLAAGLCVALVLALPLSAQGPTIAGARTALQSCTYDSCAIRLDRAFFGGRKVVVGLDGLALPMGVLGGGLADAVGRVPAAGQEVQQGRGNALKAVLAGLVSSIAVVVAVNQFDGGNSLDSNDGMAFGALGVGLAAGVTAGVQGLYAERHFSRAVWLYNRELPR